MHVLPLKVEHVTGASDPSSQRPSASKLYPVQKVERRENLLSLYRSSIPLFEAPHQLQDLNNLSANRTLQPQNPPTSGRQHLPLHLQNSSARPRTIATAPPGPLGC